MFMKPQLPPKSNMYYIFWVCVCSLSYPPCNAHALNSHLWPVWLYHIFPHYLTWNYFRKEVIVLEMCTLIFSTTCVCNISHSKKNWARYDQKCTLVFIKVPVILVRHYWELNDLDRFSKYTQIKFHENPSCGSRDVPCGRANRLNGKHYEAVTSRNFANAPKNEWS